MRILRAATLSLLCLLCAAPSVHAQDGPSSFLIWLKHMTGTGAHHRHASLPPLPKARPAELGPAAATLNKREAVTQLSISTWTPKNKHRYPAVPSTIQDCARCTRHHARCALIGTFQIPGGM